MPASRIGVALCAAFFAANASVWPSLNTRSDASKDPAPGAAVSPFPARPSAPAPSAWPPSGVKAASVDRVNPDAAPASVAARMERTSTGAHRLVVERAGTFVHLAYREASSAGPDWAAIELRAGDRAPKGDVAVWEATDPETLETRRGLVSFSLEKGAQPEVTTAEAPRRGPRSVSAVRICEAHEDGASGFAVVCHIAQGTSGVRAIRPTAAKPLSGAWVWDVPRTPKTKALRFVRFDLPLAPGGAEVGALAYVHAGKGVIVRADATWAAAGEVPSLLFTETSRVQPVSPFFSWN
jgi:hypothetical protein